MRGYYRRSAATWSAARWSTYNVMATFVGGDAMRSKGIFGPKDLLPLPWDTDDTNDPIAPAEQLTDQDVRDLQADIEAAKANGIQW
jgi:hypothetical protein